MIFDETDHKRVQALRRTGNYGMAEARRIVFFEKIERQAKMIEDRKTRMVLIDLIEFTKGDGRL